MFHSLAQAFLLALLIHAPAPWLAHSSVTAYRGTFADGATYLIQQPPNWNGTLVLYSHGYVEPGQPNPATDSGDGPTGQYLLAHGYALAGSSYASTGWDVRDALPDQIAVLTTFATLVGTPTRTIAWGQSMGGLITAGLIQQYPSFFSAALPMCPAVAGGVGTWNDFLDAAFAFNTLLANGTLQVVNIGNPAANYAAALAALSNAQATPAGQARIALAAALANIPGWYTTGSAEPAPTDYVTQEANQYLWFQQADFQFSFQLRAELESRAGGNPSFNAGIDYRKVLAQSAEHAEVSALYAAAGLNLSKDLAALNAAADIAADPAALTYLSDNIILDGAISVPVLTMQDIGDGLVVPQSETAYTTAVTQSGNAADLRKEFVARAGHCEFSSAEMIVAFNALVARLNSGTWSGLQPATLNRLASNLGGQYNDFPPAFAAFTPGPFARTYNGTPPVRTARRRHAR